MDSAKPLRRLAVSAMLWIGSHALAANGPVSAVAAVFDDPRQPRVSARVSLPLNDAIEKAVHHGVPLVLLTEVELQRGRSWIWDEELGRVVRRSELRYHALSGRYLLQGDGLERIENFRDLEEAFRYHGTLTDIPLTLPAPVVGPTERLRLAVRARIEAQDLPLLMRLLPVGTTAWHYDTGWQYFSVAPAP